VAIATAVSSPLEPGYGYKDNSLASETKNEAIIAQASLAPKSDVAQTSTETPARSEPAHTAEVPAKSEAPARSEPAHTAKAPATPDWYSMACSHATLFHAGIPQDKKCDVVTHICSGDFANFYSMFYCSLSGSWVGFFVLMIIIIFLIFKYTAIVVDEYIVPGLTKCSETLGLSESLAAVTLMALANGAGDVITALVSGSGSGGVSYNIGALYGAGLFVAVCVVSICIFMEKEIVFDRMIIYRDIGAYLIATLLTIAFAAIGFVYWWMAVAFLLVYVGYVLFVVIWERHHPEGEADDNIQLGNVSGDEEKGINAPINAAQLMGGVAKRVKTISRHPLYDSMFLKRAMSFKPKRDSVSVEEDAAEETPAGFMDALMEWVDTPYIFICKLTALPSEINDESWAAWKFYCYPVTGVFWGHWVFSGEWVNLSLLTIGVPICVAFYVLFYFGCKGGMARACLSPGELENNKTRSETSEVVADIKRGHYSLKEIVAKLQGVQKKDTRTRMTWFQWTVVILGILAGLLWTYVLVGFLIDLLNCFGVLLGLDNTFLGLTILAVGNALPDALTTISLVKAGQGTMAIAGGYAGQLFGLLVGFGLAQLKTTLISGPQTFDLFNPASLNENILDLIVIGTALICLSLTFCWGIFNKMRMTKPFAIIALIIYSAFLIACSILAISKAVANF
jgi:Ca2+/Na+ antiporter